MYRKILVTLDTTSSDREILPHIARLAVLLKSELLLVHVADGFAARHFNELRLAESDEMKADQAYLEGVAGKLRGGGLTVAIKLALGNPPTEIVRTAAAENCDLIALTSHGHRLIGDVLRAKP